ncbi:hypothetical protein CDAR_367581 [Caerostris darwini]|uniref:Uncharacterized protein n=1 Tax=Caerostris darwini TaxID=1538125 RepID=A0AAV4WVJ8_9ARAC|nr:hypothetical protein CDAR_367581 [Caerostris darwini]
MFGVIPGALPGRDVPHRASAAAPLLRVQPDPPVHADHGHRPAQLLHAFGLGGEGHPGHHHPPLHDRLPHGHRREHAAHIGHGAAHR